MRFLQIYTCISPQWYTIVSMETNKGISYAKTYQRNQKHIGRIGGRHRSRRSRGKGVAL